MRVNKTCLIGFGLLFSDLSKKRLQISFHVVSPKHFCEKLGIEETQPCSIYPQRAFMAAAPCAGVKVGDSAVLRSLGYSESK